MYSSSRQGRDVGTAETWSFAWASLYGESRREDDTVRIGSGVTWRAFLSLEPVGVVNDEVVVRCFLGVTTSSDFFLGFLGVEGVAWSSSGLRSS